MNTRWAVAVGVLAALVVACGGSSPTVPPGKFSALADQNWCGGTTTLLQDGNVLLAGGNNTGSAELYDPTASTFPATGSMVTARRGHTATLLSSGKVLIAGGALADSRPGTNASLATAELYDPITQTFMPTGSLAEPRAFHTATLLPNGTVLIVGGLDPYGEGLDVVVVAVPVVSAELYDPVAGTFTPTGSMATARWGHTATRLQSGKVLVVGSQNPPVANAELYDPMTGTFTSTQDMVVARWVHSATLLENGKVLLAGGEAKPYVNAATASAELYDPVAGTFTPTGSMATARWDHTGTLLRSGKVLVAGGLGEPGDSTDLLSAELYDPVAGTFTATGSMPSVVGIHTATLLQSGKVVLTGCMGTELYDPGP